jgi:YfiH family protein
MLIIRPYIFNNFPEIVCGFSTKTGLNRDAPYFLNMSYNVGDIISTVDENRAVFFNKLGLTTKTICYQKQVHGDTIIIAKGSGNCGESDALITNKLNLGLVISSADCPAIFIYDKKNKIIAAVHSGWRSTAKKILEQTLLKLKNEFNSKSANLICYIGPSISLKNYEVKRDVAENFDDEFINSKKGRYFLDLRNANYQMLLNAGIKKSNIQVSKLCSYEYSNLLHSYRREGEKSGRAIGVIALKGNQ